MVRHLLKRQLTVPALVRDPRGDRAKVLAGQGIEIACPLRARPEGDRGSIAVTRRYPLPADGGTLDR